MMSEAPRRTLSGLAPKAAPSGNSRLIRSKRLAEAPAAPSAPAATTSAAPAADPVPVRTPEVTELRSTGRPGAGPKYQQLRRRESRVHHDQADALTLLTRRLNKARRQPDGTTVGERITDNTLLRVAIDLLLARSDDLRGTTEAELAASLGLTPRHDIQ